MAVRLPLGPKPQQLNMRVQQKPPERILRHDVPFGYLGSEVGRVHTSKANPAETRLGASESTESIAKGVAEAADKNVLDRLRFTMPPNSFSSRSICWAASYSRLTRARPLHPRRRASALSLSNSSMRRASSPVSPQGARKPFSPSINHSRTAPVSKPTTGTPKRIASGPAIPNGSGQTDVNAKTLACT